MGYSESDSKISFSCMLERKSKGILIHLTAHERGFSINIHLLSLPRLLGESFSKSVSVVMSYFFHSSFKFCWKTGMNGNKNWG
jgi:hypothetical protein